MSAQSKPLRCSWTGGQFSIFRALLGVYLAAHFIHLAPYAAELFSNTGTLADSSASPLFALFPGLYRISDAPTFVTATTIGGALIAIALAVGLRTRVAAIALWYLLASEFTRNPLISNPSLPYVGLMLIACALQAPAPYGSLAARGRPDPGGEWRERKEVWAVLWTLMAIGYSYSGWTKLESPSWRDGTALLWLFENPLARTTSITDFMASLPEPFWKVMTWGSLALELAFALLAIFRRLRLLPWLGLFGMHLGILFVIDFADLTAAMILLHLATFDPAWLPPKSFSRPTWVFYDGECGLCHRMVRLILAEDQSGESFRFAPLQSPAFESRVDAKQRAELPDSVAVLTTDGELAVRTTAVIQILDGLGGFWRVAAFALRVPPRALVDLGYDAVASVRKKLFAKPEGACPMIPQKLGERFEF